MSEEAQDTETDIGPADQADVARLVLAMEPHLGGSEMNVVCAALASLLAAAFSQQATTAREHEALCRWLVAGLEEDRRERYGPKTAPSSTRVQ